MPRYYFNVRDGYDLDEDEEGVELPDLEAARAEAQATVEVWRVDDNTERPLGALRQQTPAALSQAVESPQRELNGWTRKWVRTRAGQAVRHCAAVFRNVWPSPTFTGLALLTASQWGERGRGANPCHGTRRSFNASCW